MSTSHSHLSVRAAGRRRDASKVGEIRTNSEDTVEEMLLPKQEHKWLLLRQRKGAGKASLRECLF